jgi:orotidine-5'-phosphate decarboxylase
MPANANERLIVALDLKDIDASRSMVHALEGTVDFFKIGLALQLAPGVEKFIHELIGSGKRVFLDYKYYDIAETVRKAVSRAAELRISFLTVHGSASVIRGAVEGRGNSDLKLFAVTVLTSLEKADIVEMGYTEHSVEQLVLFRARIALEAGCDGVIASGLEAEAIKRVSGKRLLVVTPGIRPDGYPEDDQKRKVTPGQAIAAGADYLVVGRPITGQPDPRVAAEAVAAEMQQAFDEQRSGMSVKKSPGL